MRRLGLVVALVGLAGCYETRIATVENETKSLMLANQQLQTGQPEIAEVGEDLQRRINSLSSWRTEFQSRTRILQEKLVTAWHGEQALLKTKAEKAQIPSALELFLENAQRNFGVLTTERQFLAALDASPDALGTLLADWEKRAGFTASPDQDSSRRRANACKAPRIELTCEEIRSEETPPVRRFLCAKPNTPPGGDARLVFAGLNGSAIMSVRKFGPELKSVVWSFDDGRGYDEFWLVRLEYEQPVSRSEGGRDVEGPARAWFGFLHLSHLNQGGEFELLTPIPQQGPQPVLVDLDGDAVDEVILASPPRALHFKPTERTMQRWSVKEACATPGAPTTPALQGVCGR